MTDHWRKSQYDACKCTVLHPCTPSCPLRCTGSKIGGVSTLLRGWNFKELLRNKLSLTRGWANNIEQISLNWALFLSLLCVRVSPVMMTNEWGEAFIWTKAFSHLCCKLVIHIQKSRLKLDCIEGRCLRSGPRGSRLRWQNLRLNTRTRNY